MEALIQQLINSPVSNLLVIAGLVFLGVAVVGNITGKIRPGKSGRIASGALGGILLTLGLIFYIFHIGETTSTTAVMETPSLTPVSQPPVGLHPTETFTATVSTIINTPNTPPPPNPGSSRILVPAGAFTMGSNGGDKIEQPPHTVNVSAFYIDKNEVTNALYKQCVDAGSCQPPTDPSSKTRSSYYGNPDYGEYPVIYVNWNMADAYCKWQGGRLPTEAEWEKAARGLDGRTFPWGEGVSCANANFSDCNNDTIKVGTYVSAKSPFGLFDMAGNVWEWVSDWYQGNYYSIAGNGMSDPQGPASGQERVIRGGSWMNAGKSIRSTIRNSSDPSKSSNAVGFRCVSSNP
jgi:formylglycine-generating enzyme required for sulfatase activity